MTYAKNKSGYSQADEPGTNPRRKRKPPLNRFHAPCAPEACPIKKLRRRTQRNGCEARAETKRPASDSNTTYQKTYCKAGQISQENYGQYERQTVGKTQKLRYQHRHNRQNTHKQAKDENLPGKFKYANAGYDKVAQMPELAGSYSPEIK
jgi:hypothetical protein